MSASLVQCVLGGCGARASGEAYGNDYELPSRCYNETCAACARCEEALQSERAQFGEARNVARLRLVEERLRGLDQELAGARARKQRAYASCAAVRQRLDLLVAALAEAERGRRAVGQVLELLRWNQVLGYSNQYLLHEKLGVAPAERHKVMRAAAQAVEQDGRLQDWGRRLLEVQATLREIQTRMQTGDGPSAASNGVEATADE